MSDVALVSLAVKVDSKEVVAGVAELAKLKSGAAAAEIAAKALASATVALGNAQNVVAKINRDLGAAIDAVTVAQLRQIAVAGDLSKAQLAAAASVSKAHGDASAAARQYANNVLYLDQAHRKTTSGATTVAAATKKLGVEAFLSAGKLAGLAGNAVDLFSSLASGNLSFSEMASKSDELVKVLGQMPAAFEGMGGAAALLNPVTIGVGLIAGGFAVATQQINKNADEISRGLGLTKEQLAAVKGESVTMGDTLSATLQVAGRAIMDAFGPQIEAVQKNLADFYQWWVDASIGTLKWIIGGFVGVYKAVVDTWRMLPGAFGDIMISAANLVISTVEHIVNGVINAVNFVLTLADSVRAKIGLPAAFKLVPTVDLGQLKNQFEGQAKATTDVAMKSFNVGMAEASAKMDAVGAAVSRQAVENRNTRVLDKNGKVQPAAADAPSVPTSDGATAGRSGMARAAREEAETVSGLATAYTDLEARRKAFQDDLEAHPLPKPPELQDPAKQAADRAALHGVLEATVTVDDAKANVAGLSEYAAKLAEIDKQTQDTAKSMAGAFGKVGKAIGDVATTLVHYGATQAAIESDKNKAIAAIDPKDAKAKAEIEADAAKKSAAAQVAGYLAMSSAAKGFFSEQSAGYKVIQAAEQGYRAFQMASSIQAMFQGAAETTSVVTNGAAQATANASAGATKIFAQLGMYAFPVVAAMVAVLASFGAKGGGGSGAVPGATDAKDRQESQGAGSVLGDSKGKSDSLAKALDQQLKNQNKDLEYSNQMVASLRAIQSNIGVVASLLARQLGLSTGVFDTSGLQLGTSGKPATLANLGFGKTTTNSLQDLGLQFSAETLGSIVASGVDGATYQQVLSQTKKKAFGITYSNKTSVDTTTGALDGDLTAEINRLIGSLRQGVLEGAKALGEDSAAAIDAVAVNLGKISFKDLTGAQIEEQLNAVFGKLADDLAVAAVPALTAFQKVGEGAFESLARVAREYEVVDVAFASIGRTFGEVGVGSLAARDRLVEAAGGMDAFTDQVSAYAENFLNEAERLKPIQASVTAEMTRLGYASVDTKDEFKNLVASIDPTTEAGAKLFAALMILTPAFAKVADAAAAIADRRKSIQDDIDKLTLAPAELVKRQRAEEMAATVKLDATLGPLLQIFYDLSDAADAAAKATQLANDRRSLEIQLLEAQGRSVEAVAAKRQLELAALDPSLRPIQQAVYNAQDAAAAVTSARDDLTKAYQRESAALQTTIDRFKAFAANLAKFRDSLDTGPLAQLSPGDQYQASRSAFEETAALARLGNEDALGSLQGVSEAYLGVSRSAAATAVDYQRDLASVKIAVEAAGETADRTASIADKQLEALNASVGGLITINDSVLSVAAAVNNLQGALAAARSAGVSSVGGVSLPGTVTNPGYNSPGGVVNGVPSNWYLDHAPNDLSTYEVAPDDRDWMAFNADGVRVNLGLGPDGLPLGLFQGWQQQLPNRPATMSLEDIAKGKAAWDAKQAAEAPAKEAAAREWAMANGYLNADGTPGPMSFRYGLDGFARGGAFSNGVVLRPTAFNLAQMGEAGPEAIMPLTMGPNGLGVRAAGGSSDAKELRDLKAEVANLNVALMAIAENTGATARMQRRWDGDGLPAERNVA